MVSIKGVQAQGRAPARRTDGELRRRQALADASAGIVRSVADVPSEAVKIQRFRCVIYLCCAPNGDISAPRRACVTYAEAFGWEIADVIEDWAGLLPPQGRSGLARALDEIRGGEAVAILTASRSMISPVPQEFDEVVREVETAGGFLHIRQDAPEHVGGGAC